MKAMLIIAIPMGLSALLLGAMRPIRTGPIADAAMPPHHTPEVPAGQQQFRC